MATEPTVHSGAARPLSAYLSPLGMVRNLWAHRSLTWQLAMRDIAGRYRGAWLGLLWAVLTPLILLGIYTFVFSVVFKARFAPSEAATAQAAADNAGRGMFALTLFCAMLLYGLFAEVANRAPSMVVANPNYVKRVVFPLEVLVVSGLITAVFNMMIGYAVWLVAWVAIRQSLPPWTIVFLPVVVAPVCLASLGVGWFLASLGVFVRDVGHATALAVQVLFFATPIFYSLRDVPPAFQRVMRLNPLTHAVEDVRGCLIWGESPHWGWWAMSVTVSAVLALAGYAFFLKSKRAFADVL